MSDEETILTYEIELLKREIEERQTRRTFLMNVLARVKK